MAPHCPRGHPYSFSECFGPPQGSPGRGRGGTMQHPSRGFPAHGSVEGKMWVPPGCVQALRQRLYPGTHRPCIILPLIMRCKCTLSSSWGAAGAAPMG